jgi:aryl-alcohol dehydrogenase-like predicted oxidoreductase
MTLDRREALRSLALATAGLCGAAGASSASCARAAGPLPTKAMFPASRDALHLPPIGLGTYATFDVGATEAERAPLREVLRAFVELGGSVLDSSPMYGRSEEVAGDLAAELGVREKLFVATKVWTRGRDAGIAQMNTSLARLRADPVDLMQVHNLVDTDVHLATLRAWQSQGRVRHLGITHYQASGHAAVMRVMETQAIEFVQINYSVAEREAEQELFPLARERGIRILVNRPFGGGALLTGLKSKPLPAFAAEIDCTSWAQLLLKFVITHPAVTCAIPATSKVAHLRDNMAAAQGRMPDEKLRAQIAAAAAS